VIDLGVGEASMTGVSAALVGRRHSLVDISHRDSAFTVSGDATPDVLNSGCPLDLGDEAFPARAATRMLLGKADIVLMRPDHSSLYRIECRRSFAPYVKAWLEGAALQHLAIRGAR